MKKQILVTGGAGYIGSVLVGMLLEKGYRVRVIDNLMYGGESIIDMIEHPGFEFVKGDIRQQDDIEKAMEGIYAVAHLAAIVGDPACAKNPDLTHKTNVEGAEMLYKIADQMKVQRFIFASTCSNYGKMSDPNEFVHEDSVLAPVSLYAETKVAFEKFLLEQNRGNSAKPTCMRFSTVYGLSPRVRFDLTVNEFTKELALDRELVIFGEQFWRPYCHVRDLARSVIMAIEADEEKVAFNVFNVGSTEENYQKQMIVEEILKVIPKGKVKFVEKNEDPRDYRVNFDKIKKELGFEITITVPQGIKNMYKAIKEGFVPNPDEQKYRNI